MMPHRQTAEEVLSSLESDGERGLSSAEARKRLTRDGLNELAADEPPSAWKKFFNQFRNVLVLLLLVATAISAGLWLYERESALPYEALVIFSVVLLNAVLGFVQEERAEHAVAALREMSAAQAHVVRDGERANIPTKEVVVGDIITMEGGDTIPADARLIEAIALKTAEASLTGESLPVDKDTDPISEQVELGDRTNMVFSGTAVTYGHGTAVVTATGMQTQMGLIAGALKAAPPQVTPLQTELDRVGKWLGIIVTVIAIVMSITIIAVEKVHGLTGLFDVLILAVALAVAAVPEGLPTVVTAVLALGVERMAKRNAIVRQLAAVETLGSANVIASDKTGTLTKNEMTVRAVVTASGQVRIEGTGYAPAGAVEMAEGGKIEGAMATELERALAVADRASNAVLQEHEGRWTVKGDPTEGALLVAARKAGLSAQTYETRFERIGEVPFSSERKMMTTIHTDNEENRLLAFAKGAPDVLLARCRYELQGTEQVALSDERRKAIAERNEALAREGMRTLGVAYRALPASMPEDQAVSESVEKDLIFAGLIGMIDPPRPEAQEAVARAKAAGIRALMITGDHPITAAVIASELGISDERAATTGLELENLSEDELAETVKRVSVYARVNPEHKLRIVKALKRHGAIVAMTGDGVNDAPALKTADIGVAMGITGTDVSKQAADIVLADDNFASIVAAVEEGRAIFANIRKFLRYLLASNIGEVMTMFLGVLFAGVLGLPAKDGVVVMPLLATQLLWINLVTDGAPALALGIDPGDEGIMQRPPRAIGEPVITHRMWWGIVLTGAVTALAALLILDASLPGGLIEGEGNLRYGQTMAFTTVVLSSLFTVFSARSDEQSAVTGLFSNRWLWGAVLMSMTLQAAVIYLPFLQRAFGTVGLDGRDWIRCALVASSVLWVRELEKLFARHRKERTPSTLSHGRLRET